MKWGKKNVQSGVSKKSKFPGIIDWWTVFMIDKCQLILETAYMSHKNVPTSKIDYHDQTDHQRNYSAQF